MDKLIYSPENEQALIAFVLRHPQDFLELYEIIKPENFGWACFQWVWEAYKSIYDRDLTIDIVTLGDELERKGRLKTFFLPGSKQFSSRTALGMLRDVSTSKSGLGYADNVLDYYNKRTIDNWLVKAHTFANNGRHSKEIVDMLSTNFDTLKLSGRRQRIISVSNVSDDIEHDVRERAKNPVDVWGIPFAWPYLSLLTGGKQAGELTIIAGEPAIGKTWFVNQDALETAINGFPVYIWSGEMNRKQITRRFYQLLGVDSRKMRSGTMNQDDWDIFYKAKETINQLPIYIDDNPMDLGEIQGVLTREQNTHGIKQAVLDYSLLISGAGKDEIERSANVSREFKTVCLDLGLAGILVASVNKAGMDTKSSNVTKSNMRGSGQQLHDADNVYILTTSENGFDEVSLHISKGRDLDYHMPGGIINYERVAGSPKFREMKDVSSLPDWIKDKMIDRMNERKDL